MLNKLKAFVVSMGLLGTLLFPAMMTAPAYADVTQDNINDQLCGAANTLTVNSSSNCGDTSAGSDRLNTIIKNLVNVISILVGIVAVIMIIVGGFRYVASAGKKESVESAKSTILYAIIGLIIVAVAQIIVRFVLNKTTQSTS